MVGALMAKPASRARPAETIESRPPDKSTTACRVWGDEDVCMATRYAAQGPLTTACRHISYGNCRPCALPRSAEHTSELQSPIPISYAHASSKKNKRAKNAPEPQ